MTIQSLKESLKSRESEVKCYVITELWEIVHSVEVVSTSARLANLSPQSVFWNDSVAGVCAGETR